MDASSLLAVGAIMALGAYLQTLTGFALGLIVMGLAVGLNVAPPTTMAYLVSFLSGINALMALRGHFHLIDKSLLIGLLIPALMVTPIGFLLATLLSGTFTALLEFFLGLCIIVSVILLMHSPKKQSVRSGRTSLTLAGSVAGLSGGLFATFGPPLVYMAYRQPLSLPIIRYTLQCIFMITSTCRLIIAGPSELTSPELWWLLPTGLFIVLVVTQIARSHAQYWPDSLLRKISMGILLIAGSSLCLHGIGM